MIEKAFRRMSLEGMGESPMMQVHARDHGGQTCIKGAWVSGLAHFAVKLSSIYPRPPGADAAESNGLSVLIESATGRVSACLLDNGYLTQLRTAAAGAVAAKYLAPAHVETIGVVGQASRLYGSFVQPIWFGRSRKRSFGRAV